MNAKPAVETKGKTVDITTNVDENKASLKLSGKLTVQTSPDLSDAIAELPASTNEIDIDMTDVAYVSSAGLRVLVATSKLATSRGGVMRILHPTDDVFDVLEMTGLSEVFTIER